MRGHAQKVILHPSLRLARGGEGGSRKRASVRGVKEGGTHREAGSVIRGLSQGVWLSINTVKHPGASDTLYR